MPRQRVSNRLAMLPRICPGFDLGQRERTHGKIRKSLCSFNFEWPEQEMKKLPE